MRAVFGIVVLTSMVFVFIVLYSRPDIRIISKPIDFTQKRVDLTREYIQKHYDLNVSHISIRPKMIVLHWTGTSDFNQSFGYFKNETIPDDWGSVSKASRLNVSAHFLIDRDGTIYCLMPTTYMARHIIGLNYHAIGIENVGGDDNVANLTPQQLKANIALVKHLKNEYHTIEYLIAHQEYTMLENSPLWMETNSTYRTHKVDTDMKFLESVYEHTHHLGLKRAHDAL